MATAKPKFHFISLFPEIIHAWLSTSIPGKALEKQTYDYQVIQLRDFGIGKQRQVDSPAYGGGQGMVLAIEPLVNALESVTSTLHREDYQVIYFTPCGKKMDFELMETLREESPEHSILVCGHYEGVDQRFIEHWVDLEISLGDFVLTGGELPALAFVDSYIRGLGGALDPSHFENESFGKIDPKSPSPLLEFPQFTRPAKFREHEVPQVLLSGDHKAVEAWRIRQSRAKTQSRRPDLTDL